MIITIAWAIIVLCGQGEKKKIKMVVSFGLEFQALSFTHVEEFQQLKENQTKMRRFSCVKKRKETA